MTNRRRSSNSSSFFRISLTVGIVGILIIGAGVIAFFSDRASRQVPLNVEPFPGAEPWGAPQPGRGTSQSLFFRAADQPDTVASYYNERLIEHNGGDEEALCVRLPPNGTNRIDPNNPLSIPFEYRCLFDRSNWDMTQFTRVRIYPGAPNDDPFLNAEGLTVIEYEQVWNP
ncbi:MAG: hypothetical protein GYB67_05925 [Chloroflexi bacterium]|nr:hypothetical protein [Chloroflexota bacterium]